MLTDIPAIASIILLMTASCFIKKGEITPAVNQAAAMVLRNSDKDLSWLGVKFFTTKL